ncbi:Glutaredoxin, GrxC family [Hahella chejuensis KCTC 2396]|uniref:Glutaredoxin n=1 Tax=Hahella chejuensis (strain KCTC 2396) TaxID=349521 RepID=Q2SMA5_HAHCH|nr:glutaredoxin 3 [Hahella chejuensis]ABC28219.1 Glutaredoxin, GrxC family [Hahella chejuensis KCTC 2396]
MAQFKPVTIYTTEFCPYCIRAKRLLEAKGASFEEIKVDFNAALRQEMMQKSGRRTVPQIWVGEEHVGGCDELYGLERAGTLDALLQSGASDESVSPS